MRKEYVVLFVGIALAAFGLGAITFNGNDAKPSSAIQESDSEQNRTIEGSASKQPVKPETVEDPAVEMPTFIKPSELNIVGIWVVQDANRPMGACPIWIQFFPNGEQASKNPEGRVQQALWEFSQSDEGPELLLKDGILGQTYNAITMSEVTANSFNQVDENGEVVRTFERVDQIEPACR